MKEYGPGTAKTMNRYLYFQSYLHFLATTQCKASLPAILVCEGSSSVEHVGSKELMLRMSQTLLRAMMGVEAMLTVSAHLMGKAAEVREVMAQKSQEVCMNRTQMSQFQIQLRQRRRRENLSKAWLPWSRGCLRLSR